MLFVDIMQLIIKVIVVLALLGAAYYFFSGWRPRTAGVPATPVNEPIHPRAGRIGRIVETRFARPYDRLEQLLAERNLFVSPDTLFVADGAGQQNSALDDLRIRLRLVGILLDDKPQAMIEESGQQRTHIVGIRDQVAGATVISIEEKKIILEYNGEQLELYR